MKRVFVVRIVQHRIEVELIHLRHCADIARDGAGGFGVILAQQAIEVRDLDRLATVAHEELTAGPDRSLVHAKDTELAHERIDGHLEDVRNHVSGRIGHHGDRFGGIAFALEKGRRVALGRVRHELANDLKQFLHARAGLR